MAIEVDTLAPGKVRDYDGIVVFDADRTFRKNICGMIGR